MAVFWNDIVTRDRLLAMTSDERTDALRRAIDTGLDRHSATTPWQRRYLALQSEWLLQLLPQWLEVELESSPFQVIRTEHKLSDRAIGPLRLDVRVDRIDAPMIDHVELPEATKDRAPGQLIIDYKTGNIPSGAWKGDRPDEPQLPLYAVLAEDRPIGGIAIARLKVGEMELKPRSEKEFAGQLPQWRKVLTALAESFAAGDTAVDPKNGDTCRNCAQMPLCRIRETNASDEESEESDG